MLLNIRLISHLLNIQIDQAGPGLVLLICYTRLWKQAPVVPIFKKGNSALVTNYRPISILNNFSKIV
jgi:hypothetical protein